MPGKLEPEILKERVLNFTGSRRDDLLVGGGIGEDAALIRVPAGILVAASDPITGAGANAGRLLVHINANDIACKGADPSWLIVTLIVPESLGVGYIAQTMQEIHETCEELNIAIAGGHTELTDRYTQPVLSGTMLGITTHELSAKKIRDGDVILLTGHAGLEGMSIIAHDRPDLFEGIFTPDELRTIRSWQDDLSVLRPAKILREFASYMHDPTEGGLYGALHETAQACGMGIELRDLPVNELTRRAAKTLGFEPLNLISSGMLIAVIPPDRVSDAQARLRAHNIASSIGGRFVSGKSITLSTREELWGILSRDAI